MGKRKAFILLIVIFTLVLTACGEQNDANAIEIDPLIIGRTAELAPQNEGFLACATTNAPLVIRDVLINDPELELFVRWGEPETLPEFVYPVGEERLLIVTNNALPLLFTIEDIQAIFTGRVRDWADFGAEAGEIEVWTLMPHNQAADVFIEFVMEGAAISTSAYLAGSPADVLAIVAENSNAIGYLPASWLTDAVQAVDFEITQPILAMSDEPLSAAAQTWVNCMQQGN